MSFSDSPFAYGPFVPHYIPRQYVENYFSTHRLDAFLQLSTTVEEILKLPPKYNKGYERWKLTLRKHDPVRRLDFWWEEEFDAVILANGHYSVPYVSHLSYALFSNNLAKQFQVPYVKGLEEYISKYPERISHSKEYRTPTLYANKKVLIIGNSASGHDLSVDLVGTASAPVYQSRRSKARWDGDGPLSGIEWKPTIKEYLPSGRIVFEDDTYLDDIDAVLYCTGYKPSFPFWNVETNGRPLWDYEGNKLIKTYWHTFFQDFKTLGIIGMPRTLTFRSFEYQAIALARVLSGRNAVPLPPLEEQQRWERDRAERKSRERKKFHDIMWEDGETEGWLKGLFDIAGLGSIRGEGLVPPVLSKELIWAVEHLRKYPENPGNQGNKKGGEGMEGEWVVVERQKFALGGVLP